MTERIAEGSKRHVKKGQKVSAGQVVQSGTHQTGVFHYEIRDGKAGHSGSFKGTRDPREFLTRDSTKKGRIVYQRKQAGGFVDTYTGDRELYMGTKVMPDSKQINKMQGTGYNLGGLVSSPTLPTNPVLPTQSLQAGGIVNPAATNSWMQHTEQYDESFYNRKSTPQGYVIVMGGGGSGETPLPSPPPGASTGDMELDPQPNYYDYAKLYSNYCRGVKV